MTDMVYDDQGRCVATVKDGELITDDGASVGRIRAGNVYDRNGKFIFHVQPATSEGGAGRMTAEAVHKLLHPK